ncbi:MAG: aminoglycoside 2-N-acetyltransferase [Acidimicrobiaceae bacterium]|nr:aminoglycoside 2-N-acetyltransferase [Acidimicrobiaceae bacterium]
MLQIEVARTTELTAPRLSEVRALLVDAFEGDFSDDDWRHTLGGWHVVVLEGRPVAHAAVVARTLEVGARTVRAGYVEGVATAPDRQRQGLGGQVMEHVGHLLRSEFDMGALSTHRWSFYERAGWERWQGPSFVRHGEEMLRTVDEDDGIMVLRFGVTLALGLGEPICCEYRPGDDW